MSWNNADHALPRWRQIELALLDEIERKSLAPGARLPSEHDLAQNFGVNRATLRRALAELQQKGMIRIEKGRGAFVREAPVSYAIGRQSRFGQNLASQNITSRVQILRAAEIPAPADLARRLEIAPGTPVVFFETLSFADGVPLSFTRHQLPAARVPGAPVEVAGFSCISDVYARFGLGEVTRRSTRITARLPDADEAHQLRQPMTRPILIAETIKIDPAGRPVDDTIARFAADRVHLLVGEDMDFD